MQKLLFTLACIQAFYLPAQDIPEKKIRTKVDQVTVFFKNAQITRNTTFTVSPGRTTLRFIELSPFINPKSLQVKVDGNVTVLSVNHLQNYLDSLEKPEQLVQLESRYKALEKKIELEETHISIIDEEITFLQENRNIGGRNQGINVTTLRDASEFYSTKLTSLKIKRIERTNTLADLREELQRIASQMNSLTVKREFPSGEVLVTLDAKSGTTVRIELSFLVNNAGWFPSYDIRARNIMEPLEIVYKANLHQDTRVDWKNVKLTFSSGNPNLSGIAPELTPYYLNYNSVPPTYNTRFSEVAGTVTDRFGNPLPGASVVVTGTSIGTITDMNGNYSIAIPRGATSIQYSSTGYSSKEVPISSAISNVRLQENVASLEEVATTSFAPEPEASAAKRMTVMFKDEQEEERVRIRGAASLAIPTQQLQSQTSVEFVVDIPYTVNSDRRNYLVDLTSYQVPASYEYYCVPKIEKDAFLLAYVTGWEQYNFLEGEANIYFEDTYTGKTILDVRFITDTLTLSLGRDKSVVVNREKITDLKSWKFIGSKKEEARAWKFSVRNTKSATITIALYDQVPVPTIEEIELNINDLSGGKRNRDTGEIRWDIELEPNQSKEVQLRYTLKYPKEKTIVID